MNSKFLRLIVLYSPEAKSGNHKASDKFLKEFAELLDVVITLPGKLIILGDFNYHVDDSSDCVAEQFLSMVASSNMIQHVDFPTHNKGHTLDLVLTRCDELRVTGLTSNESVPSDHKAVIFTVTVEKPPCLTRCTSFRRWKHLNSPDFRKDLLASPLQSLDCNTVSECVAKYDEVLVELLDKHLPIQNTTITIKSDAPWYNTSTRKAKVARRKAERKWRDTKSPSDYCDYKVKCFNVLKALRSARREYYHTLITQAPSQKEIFRVTNSLLNSKADRVFPATESSKELAEEFSEFFINKIKVIRENLLTQRADVVGVSEYTTPPLSSICTFSETSDSEVTEIIKSMGTKSCDLDPIPTWLLKSHLDVLASSITYIINRSLTEATFPLHFKKALVFPLLKNLH